MMLNDYLEKIQSEIEFEMYSSRLKKKILKIKLGAFRMYRSWEKKNSE